MRSLGRRLRPSLLFHILTAHGSNLGHAHLRYELEGICICQQLTSNLIDAISKRKYNDVKLFLNDKRLTCQKMYCFKSKSVLGPPLLLAIDVLDTRMVELLVELGADVNQEIVVSGKKSTLMIYAINSLVG